MILVTTNPLDGSKVDVYVADSNVSVDGLMTGNIVTYDVSSGTVIVSDRQVPIIGRRLAMTPNVSHSTRTLTSGNGSTQAVDADNMVDRHIKNGIKVDLNTQVNVLLSDEAVDILVNYYNDYPTDKTNRSFDSAYVKSKMDSDGRIMMMMWEVMSIFGEYMRNGNDKILDMIVPVPDEK